MSETGSVDGLIMLDGYGGLHEFGTSNLVQSPMPLVTDATGDYWDIVKDLEISPFYEFVTDAVVTGP
jgi:hypothetical protein